MKILAIGRNYAAHIEELNNAKPASPIIFTKPDTAIIKNNAPFYYPYFTKEIHYETEIIIKISKEGKYIQEKFAHKYYNEVGLGIDFTARDLQQIAKEKGLPWDLAKGFNGSAPISEFIPLSQIKDISRLNFSLQLNGILKQSGNTQNMLYTIEQIIAYISCFITLKKGDIIFTGTPEGVGPIQTGDRLEGFIEERKMLNFEIK